MVVHPPFCVTVILIFFFYHPFFPSIDGTILLLLTIVNIVVYLNISLVDVMYVDPQEKLVNVIYKRMYERPKLTLFNFIN